MFERLEERARAIAERRRAERLVELADRAEEAEVPGVAVEPDRAGLALIGRGLRRRMLVDPLLRWMFR